MSDEQLSAFEKLPDVKLRKLLQAQFGGFLERFSCGNNVEEQLKKKMQARSSTHVCPFAFMNALRLCLFFQAVEGLRKAPIAKLTHLANKQHYEVPTAFFETVHYRFKRFLRLLLLLPVIFRMRLVLRIYFLLVERTGAPL